MITNKGGEMGIAGEAVEEGMVQKICCLLTEKIDEYSDSPEVVLALKEVGILVLGKLSAVPGWAHEYYRLFSEGDKFDCDGLLFAIREIEKGYKLPLPAILKQCGLCLVCLGSNVPGQKDYPKEGFRCGSWCDGLLPAWGICERFKVDRQKVDKVVKHIRPDLVKK